MLVDVVAAVDDVCIEREEGEIMYPVWGLPTTILLASITCKVYINGRLGLTNCSWNLSVV